MRSFANSLRPSRVSTTTRHVSPPLPPKPVSRARPLDPVGQARVEAFAPLACRLAWYYARQKARDIPADELIAEALYGLTYAAGMFDETRQVPFGAYATLAIRHRLIQLIRSWRRAKRAAPYPTCSALGDDTAWEAEDDRPKPELVAGASARDMCDRVRRVLPARWYAVLRLYHAEGRAYQEIGDQFGVSRQFIRQVMIRATARARRHFPDWDRQGGMTPSPA